VTRHQTWGEDRVMFFDAEGRLRSILASWTSLAGGDAFTQASAGRSWFRPDDLRRLYQLIAEWQKAPTP
jgi:lipopolysaccharide biosynthesis protein